MSTLERRAGGAVWRVPANWGTWSGFLAMTFALVGLIGMFATYAIALPYQRGFHEEAALDRALTADAASLAALRPALAEQADLVIGGSGPVAERVARAREALAARVEREGGALGFTMRVWIGVFTVIMAGVGVVILGVTRRSV